MDITHHGFITTESKPFLTEQVTLCRQARFNNITLKGAKYSAVKLIGKFGAIIAADGTLVQNSVSSNFIGNLDSASKCLICTYKFEGYRWGVINLDNGCGSIDFYFTECYSIVEDSLYALVNCNKDYGILVYDVKTHKKIYKIKSTYSKNKFIVENCASKQLFEYKLNEDKGNQELDTIFQCLNSEHRVPNHSPEKYNSIYNLIDKFSLRDFNPHSRSLSKDSLHINVEYDHYNKANAFPMEPIPVSLIPYPYYMRSGSHGYLNFIVWINKKGEVIPNSLCHDFKYNETLFTWNSNFEYRFGHSIRKHSRLNETQFITINKGEHEWGIIDAKNGWNIVPCKYHNVDIIKMTLEGENIHVAYFDGNIMDLTHKKRLISDGEWKYIEASSNNYCIVCYNDKKIYPEVGEHTQKRTVIDIKGKYVCEPISCLSADFIIKKNSLFVYFETYYKKIYINCATGETQENDKNNTNSGYPRSTWSDCKSPYYNEELDADQQSIEYWNSI